jgi:hypothetical protein
MRVLYDHQPDRVYDVECPDPSMTPGTIVSVWANGCQLWEVQLNDDPSKSSTVSWMGVFHIVVGVLLLLWYYVGKSN